jgi:hypothetical protein
MPANHIVYLAQKAAAAFLRTADLSFLTDEATQIVSGISTVPRTLSQVLCQCQLAQNDDQTREGNWQAQLLIELRENAEEVTEDQHHARAGELFAHFFTATIDADLTAALPGWTVQFVLAQETGWRLEQDKGDFAAPGSWVSFLVLRLECFGGTAA